MAHETHESHHVVRVFDSLGKEKVEATELIKAVIEQAMPGWRATDVILAINAALSSGLLVRGTENVIHKPKVELGN